MSEAITGSFSWLGQRLASDFPSPGVPRLASDEPARALVQLEAP